jgi:hypothetical protein
MADELRQIRHALILKTQGEARLQITPPKRSALLLNLRPCVRGERGLYFVNRVACRGPASNNAARFRNAFGRTHRVSPDSNPTNLTPRCDGFRQRVRNQSHLLMRLMVVLPSLRGIRTASSVHSFTLGAAPTVSGWYSSS